MFCGKSDRSAERSELQSYLRPLGGRLGALATMESRAGYRSVARPLGLIIVIGSSPRRIVRCAIDVVSTQFGGGALLGRESVNRSRGSSSGRCAALEGSPIGPDSPHDAGEFVGEGDGGEVEVLAAPDA
jgi:hypothetical protein